MSFDAVALAADETRSPTEKTSKPIRIGVIGAGSLGGTVGSVLVKAGHEVKFSSRHPDELAAMARELGPRAQPFQHKTEYRSGKGHRVRTMQDNKAVHIVIIRLDQTGQFTPDGWVHV